MVNLLWNIAFHIVIIVYEKLQYPKNGGVRKANCNTSNIVLRAGGGGTSKLLRSNSKKATRECFNRMSQMVLTRIAVAVLLYVLLYVKSSTITYFLLLGWWLHFNSWHVCWKKKCGRSN
jgi:hypothetical protein